MSATNSTPTINLPVFIGTDKPAWLVDWNGAMNAIDSAIATLQTTESGTASSLAALAQSVTALSSTVSQHTTAIETVAQTATTLAGNVNTINSLIGNGEPTTTDKTLIGAINEINAKIPEGGEVEADDVTYDNTTSGLTATNVQAAIDEVNGKIPQSGSVDADDVAYDNTASGLTATDVQSAIDELANETVPNDLGASVALESYSGSAFYTFPSDGYISSSANSSCHLYGSANTSSFISVSSGDGSAVIFVRKGMRVNTVTGTFKYRPFE